MTCTFLEPALCMAFVLGDARRRGVARAAELLRRLPLVEMARLEAPELASTLTLSQADAERLAAAFQLGRLALGGPERGTKVRTAEDVQACVRTLLTGLETECFVGLYLDAQHRLLHAKRLSRGTLTESLVHPREFLRPAIRMGAAATIACHNHPSGDPEPSASDFDVTTRLLEAGRVVGIPLLDHVVVGDSGFVSLRTRMDFERAGPGAAQATRQSGRPASPAKSRDTPTRCA